MPWLTEQLFFSFLDCSPSFVCGGGCCCFIDALLFFAFLLVDVYALSPTFLFFTFDVVMCPSCRFRCFFFSLSLYVPCWRSSWGHFIAHSTCKAISCRLSLITFSQQCVLITCPDFLFIDFIDITQLIDEHLWPFFGRFLKCFPS